MNLNDRVVVLTGASSGIGAALPVEMGRHGAIVGLIARRLDRLQAVAGEVEAAGGVAHVFEVDVRDSYRLTPRHR